MQVADIGRDFDKHRCCHVIAEIRRYDVVWISSCISGWRQVDSMAPQTMSAKRSVNENKTTKDMEQVAVCTNFVVS